MRRVILPALIVLALLSGSASAAVIYSQAPYDAGQRISDFQGLNVNQQADNFSLGSQADLRALVFWGAYGGDGTAQSDDFTVRLFADNGGSPNNNPILGYEFSNLTPVSRTATGDLALGDRPIYKYAVNLASALTLNAGVTYYLSIVNNTSPDTAWGWSVLDGTADNTRWNRDADNVSWNPQSEDLAFELYDARIPLPATLGLLALGIAGLSLRGRWRTVD